MFIRLSTESGGEDPNTWLLLTVDATMSSVGPTPHFWGTVYLNVFNDQKVCIQTLKITNKH